MTDNVTQDASWPRIINHDEQQSQEHLASAKSQAAGVRAPAGIAKEKSDTEVQLDQQTQNTADPQVLPVIAHSTTP